MQQRFNRLIAGILKDRKGVAAVEFAMIFPILLVLYLGTVEISGALSTNKKISKVASSVSDLITQGDVTNRAELREIAKIGAAVLFPYVETEPTITMVGIRIDDTPAAQPTVAWSARYRGGGLSTPLTEGSPVTVPASLRVRNTFLVMTRADLSYKPIVTHSSSGEGIINMSETYYLRPRLSLEVACNDC